MEIPEDIAKQHVVTQTNIQLKDPASHFMLEKLFFIVKSATT